jgi:hypothetical protein
LTGAHFITAAAREQEFFSPKNATGCVEGHSAVQHPLHEPPNFSTMYFPSPGSLCSPDERDDGFNCPASHRDLRRRGHTAVPTHSD